MKVDKEQHGTSVSPYICSPINIADTQVHLEVLKLGRGFVHVVLAASHQQQTAGNYIRTTEYGYVVFANLYLLLSPSQNGTADFAQSWDPRVLLVMHRSNQSNTSGKELCSSTVLQRTSFSLWNCAGRCPEVNLSNQILSTILWTYSAKWIERKCLGLKHN